MDACLNNQVLSIYFISVPTQYYRTHMQDLKETTDKVHYENFRQQRLRQGPQQGAPGFVGESNI